MLVFSKSLFADAGLMALQKPVALNTFPHRDRSQCLQLDEPLIAFKKYGTSGVAMEINSMQAAFKPQEHIMKFFDLHFSTVCSTKVCCKV